MSHRKSILTSILLFLSIQSVSAQITLPYFQDFELATFPPTGCQFFQSAAGASWERVDSVGGYSQSSSSMFFDNLTVDHSGNYFGIRMPSASFTGVITPTLTFDVAYARFDASRSENLGVYYSTNGTSGWTTLANYTNATLTTAPDQTTLFVPDSSQWETKTITLSSLAGDPLIRLAFEDNSDHGNVMYIDNVHIFDADAAAVQGPADLTDQFIAYPNPVTDNLFFVTVGKIGKCEVKVFDNMGKQVNLSSAIVYDSLNKIKLDLSGISPGIYFVQMNTERGMVTKKVSKI